MRTNQMWFWFMALCLLPLTVLGQDTTPEPLPQTVSQYWDLGISIVTPLIVTGVYKIVPKIPKWVLPSITPLVGIGLGLAVNRLTDANLGWIDMAKAGALAVFIREVINQAITKQMAAKPAATPTT